MIKKVLYGKLTITYRAEISKNERSKLNSLQKWYLKNFTKNKCKRGTIIRRHILNSISSLLSQCFIIIALSCNFFNFFIWLKVYYLPHWKPFSSETFDNLDNLIWTHCHRKQLYTLYFNNRLLTPSVKLATFCYSKRVVFWTVDFANGRQVGHELGTSDVFVLTWAQLTVLTVTPCPNLHMNKMKKRENIELNCKKVQVSWEKSCGWVNPIKKWKTILFFIRFVLNKTYFYLPKRE